MPNTSFVAGGSIPTSDAVTFAKNWRNSGTQLKLTTLGQIKGFFIPKDDLDNLFNIVSNGNGAGCRAYFGIDFMAPIPFLRFMLVPTTDEEVDLWEVNGESTIYDFTRPCPSQCDTTSPLYSDANYHPHLEQPAAAETH